MSDPQSAPSAPSDPSAPVGNGDEPGPGWLTLGETADRLHVDIRVVRTMLREGELLASRREGQPKIPSAFIHEGSTSRYLRGIINLLRDGGYSDDEALDWLLRKDESLGGAPADVMHHNLHREVSRRAQSLAF